MIGEPAMDAERQRKHLTTAAIAIRSSGRAGTFSYYFPLALLFSVPLGFVAIWRKNQVMKNPDLAETLATLESLDLKTLQKLKKEGSLNGAAALFLAHRHDA